MSAQEIISDMEDKMEKAVESLISNLQGIRTGRAHPMIIERVRVDVYGASQPIKAVATITVPEPRILQIQPWDKKMIAPIEKAIMLSDVGINPVNDGINIRLVMPELNEARRKDLCKLAKGKAEDARVAVRNCRRDANNAIKKLEKDKEINEDESKSKQKLIQDKTDAVIAKLDHIADNKEKEIMQV